MCEINSSSVGSWYLWLIELIIVLDFQNPIDILHLFCYTRIVRQLRSAVPFQQLISSLQFPILSFPSCLHYSSKTPISSPWTTINGRFPKVVFLFAAASFRKSGSCLSCLPPPTKCSTSRGISCCRVSSTRTITFTRP